MSANPFFDTNVLVYLLSADTAKASRSEELLIDGGTISVQVLSEFTNVARKRFGIDWDVVEQHLVTFRETLRIEPLTVETQRRGVVLSRTNGFSIFDGMIVAAAEMAGCDALITEDMQDGQRIGSLVIRNPYRR